MATVDYTWTEDFGVVGFVDVIRWSNINAGDTCTPFPGGASLQDKTVQLLGTLGTFQLQGTNANLAENLWNVLVNEQHTPINETGGARFETVLHDPRFIRPLVTGAGAGVTVILVARRPKL